MNASMIMTTIARPVFKKSVDDVCSPLSSMPCAIIALFTSDDSSFSLFLALKLDGDGDQGSGPIKLVMIILMMIAGELNVSLIFLTIWFISEVNLWHRSLLLYHHLYTYQLYFMASLKYISDIFQLTH